jgi:hypothetical protein
MCKRIYTSHPLGAKIAEGPIRLAQSQERDVSCPIEGLEDELVRKFRDEWAAQRINTIIRNHHTAARIYGIASTGMLSDRAAPESAIDPTRLWEHRVSFNVWDPLNTSGSLIMNQDPNSPEFLKHREVAVQGTAYHRSRTITTMNEESIYIDWTPSAFGFTGRSAYQRALFPLKTYIKTMLTDYLIEDKVGVLVARMQQPGSIVDRVMQGMFGIKREKLKQAHTGNVLSIGIEEAIESLNLQNLDGPHALALNNCIRSVAVAVPMPAKMLTQEAYVEGFGEGTQDAYAVAQYIDDYRIECQPTYRFFDEIVRRRAWNPEFYETLRKRFGADAFGSKKYDQAYYEWEAAFSAPWPNLIKEEPSELVQVDDVKLKALIAVFQVMAPVLDPANRARLVQTVYDILNSQETLFVGSEFELDPDLLVDWMVEQEEQKKDMAAAGGGLESAENAGPSKPFSGRDSADVTSLMERLADARKAKRPARL